MVRAGRVEISVVGKANSNLVHGTTGGRMLRRLAKDGVSSYRSKTDFRIILE